MCPQHDYEERVWRHLNFFQHKTFIHAKLPRVRCKNPGVSTVDVPWARKGSGFTLLILLWEGDGFLLMYKRVEKGTVKWPRTSNEAKEITVQQLDMLLKGGEIEIKNPIEKVSPRSCSISDDELDELLA